MIPWHRADKVLDDLSLDIDKCRNVLSILPGQVGQQSLEIDDPSSDGRRRGDNAIAQYGLSPLCPHGGSSFRLLTLCYRYGMLFGSDCNNNTLRDVIGVKRGDTVGLNGINNSGTPSPCHALAASLSGGVAVCRQLLGLDKTQAER